MVRRALARLLLAVGLLAASVAWSGFTLQRTVFDAGRSERLATALLDDAEVEAVLVDRTAAAVGDALPPAAGSELSDAELERLARTALQAPEVDDALRTALVGSHRYLLGETTESPELSTSALDTALRSRLAAIDEGLADAAPQLPTVELELPDTGLSAVRRLRDLTDRVTELAFLVALGGVGGAFVVATNRARVLRRVGWWAIGAGGVWVVLAYGLPALARAILPSGAALVQALVDVLAQGMVVPGLVLAGAGVAAVDAGIALGRATAPGRWRPFAGRPAEPRRATAGASAREQVPGLRPMPTPTPTPTPGARPAPAGAAGSGRWGRTGAAFGRTPGRGSGPPVDRDRLRPAVPPVPNRSAVAARPARPAPVESTRRMPVLPDAGAAPVTAPLPATGSTNVSATGWADATSSIGSVTGSAGASSAGSAGAGSSSGSAGASPAGSAGIASSSASPTGSTGGAPAGSAGAASPSASTGTSAGAAPGGSAGDRRSPSADARRPVDGGRWGYAQLPEQPPAPGARWVEGVGYVDPERPERAERADGASASNAQS